MKKIVICVLGFLFIFKIYALNFNNIISSENHTLFLTDDGKIFSSGVNLYGQLGLGFISDYENFTEIKTSSKFISIAAGFEHSLAITEDGSLWGWGNNEYFQLTDKIEKNKTDILNIITVPVKLNDEKWKKIYAYGNLSFGIRNDGTLWGWGKTDYIEMGKWNNSMNEIKHPNNLSWEEVYLYEDYFVAVDSQDNLWSWGCVNQNKSYSFFDYFPQNDSFYDLNKINTENNSYFQISKYNLIQKTNIITIYGYSVAKISKIKKDLLFDINNRNEYLNRKSLFYKKNEKKYNIENIYSGYFINQKDILNEIISMESPNINICFTLIEYKNEIHLWTNGKCYKNNKVKIKNIFCGYNIYIQTEDNKLYVIGYNENNRLGLNIDENQFLFMKELKY